MYIAKLKNLFLKKERNLFHFEWRQQRKIKEKKKKLSAHFWHGGEGKSIFLWKDT